MSPRIVLESKYELGLRWRRCMSSRWLNLDDAVVTHIL